MNCSTKKILTYTGITLYFTTAFFASMVTPTLIAGKIGVDITESFCDDHEDLCNQNHYWDEDGNPVKVNLLSAIKEDAYYDPIRACILGAAIVFNFLLCTVFLPMKVYKDCKEDNPNRNDGTNSLLNNKERANNNKSSNFCSSLFSKFKEHVLPTRWETYMMTAIFTSISVGSILIDLVIANDCQTDICVPPLAIKDNPNPTYLCDNFSEIDDIHVQHEISDLADDVFDAMMWSGSTITLVTSLVFAAIIMSIYSGIKYCMNRSDTKRAENIGQGNDGFLDYSTNLN